MARPLSLLEREFALLLGIVECTEGINLPRGLHGNRIRLACRGMIDKSVRNGARGVERDLREVGHFIDAQSDFGLLHGEHCLTQVGVAHQSGVDEGGQLRIGEDLAPRGVAK